jgi:hypothetical protein
MGLTSEQVHWVLGGAISLIAVILLLRAAGVLRASWPRYFLPFGLLLLAGETFLDPLIHGLGTPQHEAAETAQHFVMGGLMAAVGLVELQRARDRLRSRFWGFLLPVGLLAVGILFLVHAQHDSAAPAILLIVQHRVMGATLVVAAAAKFLAELGQDKTRSFEAGWLVAMLVFGLELLLYTEASGAHASH